MLGMSEDNIYSLSVKNIRTAVIWALLITPPTPPKKTKQKYCAQEKGGEKPYLFHSCKVSIWVVLEGIWLCNPWARGGNSQLLSIILQACLSRDHRTGPTKYLLSSQSQWPGPAQTGHVFVWSSSFDHIFPRAWSGHSPIHLSAWKISFYHSSPSLNVTSSGKRFWLLQIKVIISFSVLWSAFVKEKN